MSGDRYRGSCTGGADVIRRFDPGRDVGALVELLESAFGAELMPRDRQWLDELGRLADLAGTRLGLVVRLVPQLAANLDGFVIEREGRILANASVMRGRDGVWAVANVVTRPEARRQGLALRLMREAVQSAREGGGRELHLQVRDDNEPARELYRGLGFRCIGSSTWLLAPAGRAGRGDGVPRDTSVPPDGLSVSAWRRSDRAEGRRLVGRADPGGYCSPRLVRDVVSADLWSGLGQLVAARPRRAITARRNGRLAAVGVARAAWPPDVHELSMVVDPRERGFPETALLASLLDTLGRHGHLDTQAEVGGDETAAIAALEAAGFARQRTLERLVLRLV